MCLSLYGYQPKASRYRKGLIAKKKNPKENTRVREKEIIKPQKETEKDKGTKRKQNTLGNKV